jgi:hypothetical protein
MTSDFIIGMLVVAFLGAITWPNIVERPLKQAKEQLMRGRRLRELNAPSR